MFRLGDDLAVRLPRRAAAAKLIAHEQRWLPRLSKRLSLPVPTPYRVGKPALGYPCQWSVVPWLKGLTADVNLDALHRAACQARSPGGLCQSLGGDIAARQGLGAALRRGVAGYRVERQPKERRTRRANLASRSRWAMRWARSPKATAWAWLRPSAALCAHRKYQCQALKYQLLRSPAAW
ncbi:MAG: phosphotransferase [Limisphaerales bacterium]